MNIEEIQRFLTEKRSGSQRNSKHSRRKDRDSKGLDGWLLYDFRGSNPIARNVTGIDDPGITRRWFCYIPLEECRYGSSTGLKFPILPTSSAKSGTTPIGENYNVRWKPSSQIAIALRWSILPLPPSLTFRGWTPAQLS